MSRSEGDKRSEKVDRRKFLESTTLGGAAAAFLSPRTAANAAPASREPDFELEEITVSRLQQEMKSGRFTSRSVTAMYLRRIEEADKRTVNSVIEVNPDAMVIAAALDHERKARGLRGATPRHSGLDQRQHRNA